jgi:hypothetical protein
MSVHEYILWDRLGQSIYMVGICPASQVKKTKVRPDYSSAPTQLALCLRLATPYKARAGYAL